MQHDKNWILIYLLRQLRNAHSEGSFGWKTYLFRSYNIASNWNWSIL